MSFYNDHDQKCVERIGALRSEIDVKITKITNTANTAVQTARSTASKCSASPSAEQMDNNAKSKWLGR